MISNGLSLSTHRSICISMQSPGALWQCLLVPRRLGFHAIIKLDDRYDGTARIIERSFIDLRKLSIASDGWPIIDTTSFRIQKNQDKHGTFLSGFIEENKASTLQWDIQLFTNMEEPEQNSYNAQGRIIYNEQEFLFPRVSTRVSLKYNVTHVDL